MLVVVRVQRPTVVADGTTRTKAAAQTVHDVLADDGAAGLEHPGDHRGVEVGNKAFQRERAEAHRHSGYRDVVLVADGLAGQQPFWCPRDLALPPPGVERVF